MGKQWKQCQTILGGSKITVDGECSHEIKRCLLLGRIVVKQRHYFANKCPSSQGYGFSSPWGSQNESDTYKSDMYRCVSWTIKKAEH